MSAFFELFKVVSMVFPHLLLHGMQGEFRFVANTLALSPAWVLVYGLTEECAIETSVLRSQIYPPHVQGTIGFFNACGSLEFGRGAQIPGDQLLILL